MWKEFLPYPPWFWSHPKAPQTLAKCSTMSLYVPIPEEGNKMKKKIADKTLNV